jgi:hypothetical protein
LPANPVTATTPKERETNMGGTATTSDVPQWKQYRRKGLSEMRPYIPGESLNGISVSDADKPNIGVGGMIARNPDNHGDQWYVAKEYFEKNLELIPPPEAETPKPA